ncbi:MAG: Phosphoheptose isomerase 1 [Nitrosomonadaceae bacterium]|nr:Phosphoheptose isomerase 1 [Nitrosomonadaceae bacterium]
MDNAKAAEVTRLQFQEAMSAHKELLNSSEIIGQLVTWARKCADALAVGGVIFFAGNGGSFADAQHLAAELTGTMGRMRSPLAGMALGTNSSSMSAIGNDFGYEVTFARELEGLGRPHSVVIGLSTSGNSTNILELLARAKFLESPVLVLTGAKGGAVAQRCDVIRVPSERTERIQEMHILLGHTLCFLIEEFLGHCASELVS